MLLITNTVARELAIIKQGLDKIPTANNNKSTVLDAITKIKLIQLDSINVAERSHYLVLLSRIGLYNKADLDELLFPDRMLFEQWSHANCLIPMKFYPLYLPEIENRRNLPMRYGRLRQLGKNPDEFFNNVLERIEKEGPLSSRSFSEAISQKRSWWNRKPARVALDVLWNRGYLAVSRRESFRCYYDLVKRVIPSKYMENKYSLEDFRKWCVINSLDAIGVGTVGDIADYFRQKIPFVRKALEQLVDEGLVSPVTTQEWSEMAYILTADVQLAEVIQAGDYSFERTTFLSPFDNLIWFRNRTERLFNFHFRVEMYTPKTERIFGYYLMPILYKDRIIGMLDPKIDRKSKELKINFLVIEKSVEADNNLVNALISTFSEFMKFNGCESITFNASCELKKELNGLTIKN